MSFDYDPNDKTESSGKAEPGVYAFVIDEIEEMQYKSGNDGWNIKMMVGAFANGDITVYDTIVKTKNSLWRFEQLCLAVGKDFYAKPDGGWLPEHFEGLTGVAAFVSGEKYLEVDEYLSTDYERALTNERKPERKATPPPQDEGPPPQTDDDAPF